MSTQYLTETATPGAYITTCRLGINRDVIFSGTHERSEVRECSTLGEHAASVRGWTRVIGGKLYSFKLIVMKSGEIRIDRHVFNGYVGGTRFGCAWTWLGMITIPAAPKPELLPEPIAYDVEHEDVIAGGWVGLVTRVDTSDEAVDRAWFLRRLPYTRNVRIVPVFGLRPRAQHPTEGECEWCGRSIRLVLDVSAWFDLNGSGDCTHAPRVGTDVVSGGVAGLHSPR